MQDAFKAATYAASTLLPEPKRRRPPNDAAYWLAGFALGIIALFALFAAAYPSNGFSYWEGLLLCVLAIAVIFALIKFRFDRIEEVERDQAPES